jgi:hypothetical protein
MMKVNKFIPIDKKYTDPDYVNDIQPFEIRFAFNSFAPYLGIKNGKKYPYNQRFVENKFNSETGSGDIMYYPNYVEDGEFMKLYKHKELYLLIDDEIVCIDNNSLLYPFIERFAEGFTKGYFEVKNNLEIENNEEKVFNIAINESLSGLDTAYEIHDVEGHYIKFLSDKLIFESGVKTGRNYRAWQVILDKPHLYIQLFRQSELLIGYYRWSLEYEIERKTPNDVWGRKKGLEILLKHDIEPQLLEKEENKMLAYGSLKPAPKAEEQGNDENKYPAIVVMAVSQIINRIEPFLPTEETDFERKVFLTQTAIYNKLQLSVGNGIRNHFNPFEKLTKPHKKKIVELLNFKGYTPQAKDFELKM